MIDLAYVLKQNGYTVSTQETRGQDAVFHLIGVEPQHLREICTLTESVAGFTGFEIGFRIKHRPDANTYTYVCDLVVPQYYEQFYNKR